MSLVIFYYGLYASKGFFTNRVLILGRGLEGSIWILMGSTLWIVPIRKMVADSIGTNDQCFQNLLYYYQRWNKKKMSKDHLIHLVDNFDDDCPFSRIISPFLDKDIQAWYFSKKSQPNKWITAEGLRRKVWVSLKRPKQKGMSSETGTSWGSLEIPTIWTVLALQGIYSCFLTY